MSLSKQKIIKDFDWKDIRAVVFDVDGTLYNQFMLRLNMAFLMVRACLVNPFKWRDIYIIFKFRRIREIFSENNCHDFFNRQYEETARITGVPVNVVRHSVKKWIMEKPLTILKFWRYPEIKNFLSLLESYSIKLAFFSDYPISEKLSSMNIRKNVRKICSSDAIINAPKPDPKGLLYAINLLGVPPKSCVFIGDRDDKDGECARRAGVHYLIKVRKMDDINQFSSYKDLIKDFRSELLTCKQPHPEQYPDYDELDE